ncbi:alcohol dehydrogenase [Xylanimonas oleitrophica]|uniref:Alcohol dehydrogenase n=1 Tax=Xylanimonas oleitrophica TaxID=2607479 RepID=A0A2W5XX97_9MICO|nr:alcohol dehydrogenase catalytic domain-containing protein [Xylanimonas oleitrophica]PZR55328.1 alcohol dehydrogenase [Xylanimonas oleitrophica]
MRAIVFDQFAGPVSVRDVPAPTAPPGAVVVEVRATGLCLSDWHAWAGHDTDIPALPHVPGHELAGVVTSVGDGVRRWKAGDRVTAPFVCGCGTCEWCTSGQAQVCPDQTQPGFTHWGSYAEQVVLHAADANLVAIPDGVGFATAASLGCRFATAYRAVVGRAQVQRGERVVVIGAGGVGLSAVMVAAARGAQVVAVDRHDGALQTARRAGAAHTVLAGPTTDVPAAVHELTGGAHVTVDAVGSEQTCADAVLSLRRRGRHVQVGLIPPVEGHPRVPMSRVIAWELDVLGSHGMAAADYPEMLALVAAGALRPQDLVERVVGLEEGAALLPGLRDAPRAGMTVIDPRR